MVEEHKDKKSSWKRDIFLIPLIIAMLAAFFSYLLPKFLEKGKELSYLIDGPTSYISQQAVGNISITVNGVSTSSLYAYKVRLWNSGGSPMKDIPIRFSFNPNQQSFQIFNVSHETNPRVEFGKIEENGSDANSKRFVYELLNPNDEDVVTFLVNEDAPLNLYAKSESLKLLHITNKEPTKWSTILSVVGIGFGVIASLISLGLKYISEKWNVWPFN